MDLLHLLSFDWCRNYDEDDDKDPESVHKLCEISLENCIRFADATIKQGIGISIAEPMSSCTVVSPKHFREFSKPYLKRFIDFIKSKGSGASIHMWKDR